MNIVKEGSQREISKSLKLYFNDSPNPRHFFFEPLIYDRDPNRIDMEEEVLLNKSYLPTWNAIDIKGILRLRVIDKDGDGMKREI